MSFVPQGSVPISSVGNTNAPGFGENILPGTPLLPGFGPGASYRNIRGSDQLLDPSLQLQGNPQAINALRAELTGTSPLGSSQQALQNLDAQLARRGSEQAKITSRGVSQALNQGGASGLNALNQQFNAINEANAQSLNQAGQIAGQDLATRIQGLTQLPGQELLSLQPQQFNISQALAERERENRAKLQDFQQRAQIYGAAGQANAILKSGEDAGIFGLGLFGL